MTINGANMGALLQQMQAAAEQAAGPAGTANSARADAAKNTSFADALSHSIDRIDGLKHAATAAGHAYESGAPGVSLNQVMVDMAKADVATNMGIQVRNRVVNAYKDIMNMRV